MFLHTDRLLCNGICSLRMPHRPCVPENGVHAVSSLSKQCRVFLRMPCVPCVCRVFLHMPCVPCACHAMPCVPVHAMHAVCFCTCHACSALLCMPHVHVLLRTPCHAVRSCTCVPAPVFLHLCSCTCGLPWRLVIFQLQHLPNLK